MMKQKKDRKYSLVAAIVVTISLLTLLVNCSVRTVRMRQGLEYYRAGDYDKAVDYFQEMLKTYPTHREIRGLLFRAKLNSYYYHLALARKYKELNKKEEAETEYRLALAAFPDNKRLKDEYDLFMGVAKKERKPFKSTVIPPVSLEVNTQDKISLKLRSVPITKIFKMLGKSSNVNFIFDKDFRDFVYTIEIENIGFYEILNQLCMISSTKYRVIDTASILIFPDTTFKIRTFSLRGIKVFYLSNVKAEDAKKLVMTVFREEQIMVQEDTNLNGLIVKAADDTLRDIEKFIRKVDKPKGEVEIDIEIIEVNRNVLSRIGASYGGTLLSLSAGVGGDTGQVNPTLEVGDLDNVNFYLTLPSAALNFLATDDNGKIISRPNLRGVNDEEIKFMVGDEVPIPQTQFQSIAAGGINNTPVTTYQYKNVGVEVKVTPFIHANNEITLKTKMTINFLSGSVDNFPIFGKRELENIIRLKEGETNIIGGFIRDEERGAVGGLPALSKIPVLGRLFGSNERTIKQTDLIFSITPRVIKRLEVSDTDQETIWANSLEGGGQENQRIVEPSGDEGPRRKPGAGIVISPSRRRVASNQEAVFSIRLNSSDSLSSLSVAGSISGGDVSIEELKTDFFSSDKVKVLKNFSGSSFDLGYSFVSGSAPGTILAQLKAKFTGKGKYTISINSVTGYTKGRKQVELQTSTAEVEVF
jgi:type II secretory pathway component GspD/PulD (secretin)